MKGDGEPVGLVTQPLQQVEPLRGTRQDDRPLLVGQPHLLKTFGEATQGDLVVQPELLKHLLGGMHLRGTPVDDDEVRGVGELARGTGRGVDESTGDLTVGFGGSSHLFPILLQAAKAP